MLYNSEQAAPSRNHLPRRGDTLKIYQKNGGGDYGYHSIYV